MLFLETKSIHELYQMEQKYHFPEGPLLSQMGQKYHLISDGIFAPFEKVHVYFYDPKKA